MSKSQSLQRVLAPAKQKEKKYDWVKAAELYEQALGAVGKKDFLEKGKIQERIGFCFYRAAMQAESREEFKERMQRAIEAYEDAGRTFEKMTREEKAAWMFRCEAVAKYLGYWVTSDPSEKRRLLDECWRLTRKALDGFTEAGDAWEYGKTYNQLSVSALFRFFYDWNFQARENMVREAADYGEQAIRNLSSFEDFHELARAYVRTATYHEMLGFYFLDLDERESDYQKALDYWLKANELSEEAAHIELLNSCALAALESLGWEWGTDTTLTNFSKALKHGRKTKNRLIIGLALDWLAFHTLFYAEACETREEMVELFERALQYAKDAKQLYSPISFISPLWGALWTEAPYALYYWYLATYEADPKKRRGLLEKAAEAAADQLKRSKGSGYPEVLMFAYHASGDIFLSLARIEKNSSEKKRFLEKALAHQNEAVEIIGQFIPFYYWKRGKMQTFVADIKSELVDLIQDPGLKKAILQEAVLDKENSLKLAIKYAEFWEGIGSIPALFANLGNWQYGYGDMLNRFYEFNFNSEHLRKAIEAFEEAIETFRKLNLISRMAECYWKTAQTCDILGEHLRAANGFRIASECYLKSAEKFPQLKDFYQDHASYMEAWTEIEKARHYHARQEYGQAKKHYEKAANLHKSSKPWKYLASNYLAWVQLEHGEDLSRNEQSQEAIQAFRKAADLFREAQRTLQVESDKIKNEDEKDLANSLVKASDIRREYCLGRITLEEAKILDRQGDHAASSRKYGSATEKFQKATDAMERESVRLEFRPILCLCRAWQMMKRAEAEASPDLYLEASQLFDEAKDQSLNEQAKVLALGHSRFCKALEAGTRFEATRDTTLHSAATQHLASAANYYVRAGFKTASEYAKATQRLFDAYVYMDNAKKETDPEKKTRYYVTAEKVLQTSADSYMKAKHSEKSEEVQRLLESVKEERKLAMSLTEVLHAPTIASSTTSFSTPTATQENAVGLERFEHTNVQAHLTASEEVTIGEELEVRLDLVNVAKNFGLLVRVDDLVSPSFKVTALPSQYHIENGSIDMKGKRLEPLKVESIKLSLQATEAGVIELKPQVVYVDEVGKFSTCRPEPVTITVHPKLTFEFKTKAAQSVFDFLISSFVEDYMRRKISLEKSGWRTLMQIIKQAKVSKSSVYGARGRRGPAISELERRGLVEKRVFPGERGRGGRILKMRIFYEKETIKRHIDQRIMKIKEK